MLKNFFVKDFFIRNGITDKEGVFTALPAKSLTVVNGKEIIPDDFRGVARNVTIKGGVLNHSKYETVSIDGINSPALKIEASHASVHDSNIGSVTAEETLLVENSTINGNAAAKDAHVEGKTQIGGNLSAKNWITCFTDSEVGIKGDVFAKKFSVLPDSNVVIDGKLGTRKKPIREIFIDEGSLKPNEAHAEKLDIERDGKFSAKVMDVKYAPLKAIIQHAGERINPRSWSWPWSKTLENQH